MEVDAEKSELQRKVTQLESELRQEKAKTRNLQEEVKQMRLVQQNMQTQAEQEEEYKVLKMLKTVEQLKKEKEELARQVEEEEEYLTNTLQKKLEQLRKEKGDLENQLEQETEYLVNKLQKQLGKILEEKESLQQKLEAETLAHSQKLAQVQLELENLTNDKIQYEKKQQELISKNDELRAHLHEIKTNNFVLKQKIFREHEKLEQSQREKVLLETSLEVKQERQFNQDSRRIRHRSTSESDIYPISMSLSNQSSQTQRKSSLPKKVLCLKEGWVKRKSASNWNRRYCTLMSSGELLFYHWNDEIARIELSPPQSIDLDAVHSVREVKTGESSDNPHKHCLALDLGVDEIHELSFENSNELKEWGKLLNDFVVQ